MGFRKIIWTIILFCICILPGNIHASQNLVLHTLPRYSPKPNYAHTSSSADEAKKLTDGIFSRRHFWTSRETTVGWQSSGLIRIDFDLHSQATLNSITISTARGDNAGVSFPVRVDVYCSSDGKHYRYMGNALDGADLSDGPYLTKRFRSKLPNPAARYVTLFIAPKGKFVFFDEIEIFGNPGVQNASAAPVAIPKGQLGNFQSNILKADHERRVWAFLKSRILQYQLQKHPGRLLDKQLDNILGNSTELFDLNADWIDAEGAGRLVSWVDNPWAQFTPVDVPPGPESLPVLFFHVARGGASTQSISLVSTFRYAIDANFTIIWDNDYGLDRPEISVYECALVSTRLGELLADPLLPIDDLLTFTPGKSRQFMLTAHGGKPGKYSGALQVASGESLLRIPFQVQIYRFRLNENELPDSNVWAYLNWRQIKHISLKALDDLRDHHVNVGIIHPRQLPLPKKGFGLENAGKFEVALGLQKDRKNILLFVNLRDPVVVDRFGNYRNRSVWNVQLESWIRDLRALSDKVGYDSRRLLFYPVDEPQDSAHVERIINFATVLKKVDPALRVYTTVDRIKRLPVYDFRRLVEMCDVFQIDEGELFSETVQYLRSLNKDVWIYSTAGGKSSSAMGLYRLMAWRAFRGGATGIGFWAYADIGPEGSVWDDTDGSRADFSVIYGDNDRIFSSKRWEAWREGCEDYALLRQVERKIAGTTLEKKFYNGIDYIITNPDDYEFFEKFRIFLLETASR